MDLIIITIVFIGTLAFIYFWQNKRDKAEENRFREFVIANKSKDVSEYTTALPSIDDTPLPKQEEWQDVTEVEPEKLLEAIKNEDASN
jgi:hypothetical protein